MKNYVSDSFFERILIAIRIGFENLSTTDWIILIGVPVIVIGGLLLAAKLKIVHAHHKQDKNCNHNK